MAGPRTLPRLFASGLATKAHEQEFVASARKVRDDWAKLTTPEARVDKLFDGVKKILDDEKVFTPGHELGPTGKAAGVFNPKFPTTSPKARWTVRCRPGWSSRPRRSSGNPCTAAGAPTMRRRRKRRRHWPS